MPIGNHKGSHVQGRHASGRNASSASSSYRSAAAQQGASAKPARARQSQYQHQARQASQAERPGGTTAFPSAGAKSGYVSGSYHVPTGEGRRAAIGSRSAQAPIAGGAGQFAAAGVVGGSGGVGQYSRNSYGSAARHNGGNGGKGGGPFRVVFIVAIIVLVASLCALGAIGYQYFAQQRAYGDLEQYAEVSDVQGSGGNVSLSSLSVDWDSLRAINPDIVAWIYVPDTPINYPVVQGVDNEEYLHKAFDGSTGWLASAGTIFLDSNNKSDLTDRNSGLYGHHMNDGSMFASLADFVDQSTFDSHRDIYVLTPSGNYRLTTFAVVKTVGSDAIVQTSFADDASYQAYVQDKLDRSSVSQSGTVLTASDVKQSMLFSTCEYTQNDGRSVLFAAVVETTAANDPYLTGTQQGTTNLSSNTNTVMDRDY